jgi:hypothetical protein
VRQGAKEEATGKFKGHLQPRDKLGSKLRIRQMPRLQKRKKMKKLFVGCDRTCKRWVIAFGSLSCSAGSGCPENSVSVCGYTIQSICLSACLYIRHSISKIQSVHMSVLLLASLILIAFNDPNIEELLNNAHQRSICKVKACITSDKENGSPTQHKKRV